MKANELMIGDWVLSKSDDKKYKINSIITQDDGTILLATEDGLHFDYMYEPIPLTAEILEKNGFEIQDQGGGRKDVWTGFGVDCEGDIEVEFNCDIPTHLKIDGVFKGEYYVSTNIKYVHKLQHALRDCGMRKLANNFKI